MIQFLSGVLDNLKTRARDQCSCFPTISSGQLGGSAQSDASTNEYEANWVLG